MHSGPLDRLWTTQIRSVILKASRDFNSDFLTRVCTPPRIVLSQFLPKPSILAGATILTGQSESSVLLSVTATIAGSIERSVVVTTIDRLLAAITY